MTVVDDSNAFVLDIGNANTVWGYAGDEDPRQSSTSAWGQKETDGKWLPGPCNFLELRESVAPHFMHNFGSLPKILQDYAQMRSGYRSSRRRASINDVSVTDTTTSTGPATGGRPSIQGRLSKPMLAKTLNHVDTFYTGMHSLKGRPLLCTEPTKKTAQYSRAMAETAFEKGDVAAFASVRKATLSAFALGRPTALVAETGPMGVTITPVFEGYTLQRNLQQYAVGGLMLDWLLASAVKLWDGEKGTFHESLQPFHSLKAGRSRTGPFGVAPSRSTASPLLNLKVHPSYLHQARRLCIEEIKYQCLTVKESHRETNQTSANADAMGDAEETMDSEDIPFELPDGQLMYIPRATATDLTEFLFEPSDSPISNQLLNPFWNDLSPLIRTWPGLPTAITSAAFGCDVDVIVAMMANIVVSGGPSSMEGYLERLASDLSSSSHVDVAVRERIGPLATANAANMKDLSQLKVKVAAQSSFERRFTTWVGGSMLSMLSSFEPFWISKADWDEHGADILDKRLVF